MLTDVMFYFSPLSKCHTRLDVCGSGGSQPASLSPSSGFRNGCVVRPEPNSLGCVCHLAFAVWAMWWCWCTQCVEWMHRFDVQHVGVGRARHGYKTDASSTPCFCTNGVLTCYANAGCCFHCTAERINRTHIQCVQGATGFLIPDLAGGGDYACYAGFGLSSRRCVFVCQGWGFEYRAVCCRKPTLTTEPPACTA